MHQTTQCVREVLCGGPHTSGLFAEGPVEALGRAEGVGDLAEQRHRAAGICLGDD